MDTQRFDDLTRGLIAGPSRRGLLRTFLGTVVAFTGATAVASPMVEARKRKRKKKKKKTCGSGETRCGNQCVDLQADPLNCGSCGNSCANRLLCVNDQCVDQCGGCLVGQVCDNTTCTCPAQACAQATDPTNDQFEQCFCNATVEGEQACFANIACSPLPPTCTTSSECGAGFACFAIGCGGQDRCTPLCALS